MNYLKRIIYLTILLNILISQDLGYKKIASGFKKPLYLMSHVTKSNILFVVEQRGIIWSLVDGKKEKNPFLDIRDRVHTPIFPGDERGLLGFAMSPHYSRDNSSKD